MTRDERTRAVKWLQGSDTGVSSETIWRVLMKETPKRMDIPYDPSDFGRCYRLLRAVPSFRPRLVEVARACPKWKPFVEAWDELTKLYENECNNPDGLAPKLYARMRQIRGVRP